jgi:hypothetical protein
MERNELVEKIFKIMGEDVLEEEQVKEIKEEMDIEGLKELLKVLEVLGYEDEDEEDEHEGCCGGKCDGKCKCNKITKDDIDVEVGILGIVEEITRQENLYEKEFEVSEETKATNLYKEMMVMAESIIAGVRVMIEGGIDYNNALQLCSNHIQNKQNLEIAKLTQIQVQNNQI